MVDLSQLPEHLARDIEDSLATALAGGAVFAQDADPSSIAQSALSAAVRDIETHPRGESLRRFLTVGPYHDGGEIPLGFEDRLSDEETAAVIAFLYSHTVQTFQGALAELLAAGPCLRLVETLQEEGRLPEKARLFVGDTVLAGASGRYGRFKAADFHILVEDEPTRTITVAGVVEVKSFRRSRRRLDLQLAEHLARVAGGIIVRGIAYPPDQIRMSWDGRTSIAVRVVPDRWSLPRSFRFEEVDGGTFLHVEPPIPPNAEDLVKAVGPGKWEITLRWSQEALAAVALEMAFWWMEVFGEVLYADGVPPEWCELSPAEAGRNAAKMMLYYAILRSRDRREESRAIALYNSFGFGYAPGMNFRDSRRRRHMLWAEDLREILEKGRTAKGCRIVTPR